MKIDFIELYNFVCDFGEVYNVVVFYLEVIEELQVVV